MKQFNIDEFLRDRLRNTSKSLNSPTVFFGVVAIARGSASTSAVGYCYTPFHIHTYTKYSIIEF